MKQTAIMGKRPLLDDHWRFMLLWFGEVQFPCRPCRREELVVVGGIRRVNLWRMEYGVREYEWPR